MKIIRIRGSIRKNINDVYTATSRDVVVQYDDMRLYMSQQGSSIVANKRKEIIPISIPEGN